jgi:Zn-dependent protease with chaperone function
MMPGIRLRPSVFVLGADTRFRFGLLVAAIVGTTPFLTAPWGYDIVPGAKEQELALEACLRRTLESVPPVGGKSLPERLDSAGKLVETCVPYAIVGMGVYSIFMIVLVFVIAFGIYWWLPIWRIRRRRLVPLPSATEVADVHALLHELEGATGVNRVRYLIDPLDRRVTGLAFGRVGRRQIVLSRGLVQSASTDPDLFRAVMLHELAHVYNGDLESTYLTIATWRAWAGLVLIPIVPGVIVSGQVAVGWRLAAAAILVRVVRNATLRSRERYADSQAAQWGAAHALHRALGERPFPRTFRRRLGTHPEAARRQTALEDPTRVIAAGAMDGLTLGVTTVFAASSITLVQQWLFLDSPIPSWVHLLPFVVILACALVFTIFRMLLAAGVSGVRARLDALGVGLGGGFALGVVISPRSGVVSSDVLAYGVSSMPNGLWMVWAGLMVAGGWLSIRWIGELVEAWLPYITSRPSPLPGVLGCTAAVAMVLAAWLMFVLFIPVATSFVALAVLPDYPPGLVFLGVLVAIPGAVVPLWILFFFVTLVWAAPYAGTWVRTGRARSWISVDPLPEDARFTGPPPRPAWGVRAALKTIVGVAVGALVVFLLILAAIPPSKRAAGLPSLVAFAVVLGVLAQILAAVVAAAKAPTLRLSHAVLAATIAGLPAIVCANVALTVDLCLIGPCIPLMDSARLGLAVTGYRIGLVLSLAVALALAGLFFVRAARRAEHISPSNPGNRVTHSP